ncbi:kinase-like protein [Sistotremastrum niveocremeum HHB9708]|uniref:Kinase-like protein n=1 Tax=Sistotremastrum niveocremeum HHB9708 TaxID=1314777 RepID=A0A164XAR1_9AGAM|nr:kinase-like protein [Sistotremastrum niveocremeum HHB9708]
MPSNIADDQIVRSKSASYCHQGRDICAKFITQRPGGQRETLVLSLNMPIIIGRGRQCSYVIKDPTVSTIHCKIYAVPSSTGEMLISCQDVSTNGILLNGHKIRKSSVFLLEGDVFEIPASQSFTCHILKVPLRPKAHLFDPTPPVKPAHKVALIPFLDFLTSLAQVVGKYKIQSHCLGTGSFASVFLAIDSENYRQVACKTLNIRPHPKQSAPEAEKKKVLKEANLLKSLCHPNINKVLEVAYEDSWIHIFLDLATGGDLFTYITTGGHKDFRLLEGEAKWITYQLMKGLDYLHDLNVSHRGAILVQPENVLLCAPGPYPRVIIADFGLARQKAWQATFNAVGTVPYMSPEAILALANPKSKYVGMPADCWSLGCCVYTMLAGAHPFDHDETSMDPQADWAYSHPDLSQVSVTSDNIVKARIMKGNMDFTTKIWNTLPDARELTQALLISDCDKRMTIKGSLKSKWITIDVEELEKWYKTRVAADCDG